MGPLAKVFPWISSAQVDDSSAVERLHPSQVEHVTQAELNDMLEIDPLGAFPLAFEKGDAMFE